MRCALVCVLFVICLAGCPPTASNPSKLTAVIGISSTRGTAPLRVFVSAADSTSADAEITAFAWDFASQASADTSTASHTFANPGDYDVTLTVTDSNGKQASATTSVHVFGSDANQPAAVIKSNLDAGEAPLAIDFDGTQSSAPNDSIKDYFWNFGDGAEARSPTASHTYYTNGAYTVTLRVVTTGDLEANASKLISVGLGAASLRFTAQQFASLPISVPAKGNQFTFETWLRTTGGGVFVSEGKFSLEVRTDSKLIHAAFDTSSADASVPKLDDGWHHVAIASAEGGDVIIYFDGESAGTGKLDASISMGILKLGDGFAGKLGEARLWSSVRTGDEIASNMSRRISDAATDLLGGWPLNEGVGVGLANVSRLSDNGVLGTNSDGEDVDPTWSTDAPPVH